MDIDDASTSGEELNWGGWLMTYFQERMCAFPSPANRYRDQETEFCSDLMGYVYVFVCVCVCV